MWKKACSNSHGCVEVEITKVNVKVRDSKLGDNSPILYFTHKEWTDFLDGVDSGEFDISS